MFNNEIITDMGTYTKALVTNDFIYYINKLESDENGCCIMYRLKDSTLVSDNYFAYSSLVGDVERIINNELEYSFADNELIENFKEIYE